MYNGVISKTSLPHVPAMMMPTFLLSYKTQLLASTGIQRIMLRATIYNNLYSYTNVVKNVQIKLEILVRCALFRLNIVSLHRSPSCQRARARLRFLAGSAKCFNLVDIGWHARLGSM